jgi:hypothetical protein
VTTRAVRPLSARYGACAVGALVVSVWLVNLTACVTSAPPMRTAGPMAVGLEGVPVVSYGVRDCAAGAARLERAWAPTGHLMLRLRPEPGWEPR